MKELFQTKKEIKIEVQKELKIEIEDLKSKKDVEESSKIDFLFKNY